MLLNKKFLFSTAFLALTSIAQAETYYVSPTGSASWAQCAESSGGISTPCSGKTAVENAVAGDLVYFLGGTYDPAADPIDEYAAIPDSLKWEFLPWNPSNSGTAGNPITFKAYPGQTPVFIDSIYGGVIGARHRDYIVWDGFSGTIVNSTAPGLEVIAFAYFVDTSNCVFRNGNITGILKDTHHNSGLISLLRTQNMLIEYNQLHGMNDDPDGPSSEVAVNASAILSFNSSGMVVRNNDIYNNYLGIWDKDAEANNRYYQNHIWGGNTASTRCHVGIQIREGIVRPDQPDNAQAYQNIIRNCDIGAWVSYDDTYINAAKVFNNVIYLDNGYDPEAGIMVSTNAVDTEIYNNIVDGYTYPLMYFNPSSTVNYSDNNNYFNSSYMSWRIGYSSISSSLASWEATTNLDGNSILTNPEFVNPGGNNPSDYQLAVSSPAKGIGRGGVDLGAYPTTSSTSIGYSQVRPKSPVILQP